MDHQRHAQLPFKNAKEILTVQRILALSSSSSSSSKTNKNQKTNAQNQQKQILSRALSLKRERKTKEIKKFYAFSTMRRKCTTIGEIAVVELADVRVRTRAMAATETVQKKRRRLNDEEGVAFKVTSSTTSYIQLRSRRILVDHHRLVENGCLSPKSNHDDDVSCCSSNIGSSEKRITELPDLEDESVEVETSTHFCCRESSREPTPSSELRAEPEDLDSTSRPSEANSRRRSTVEKMPTEAELEEFFAVAEKKLQKQFAEKYNYDTVKDEPLEGRYEWVRLKP